MLRYAGVALIPLLIFGAAALADAADLFPEEAHPGRVGVADLDAGDCFDAPDVSITISQVDGRRCDEAHQYEVVAVISWPLERGTAYPGEDELTTYAQRECEREFESYVGVPYEDSVYWTTLIFPIEEGWEAGDRETTCAAYHPQEATMEGSIRGTRR